MADKWTIKSLRDRAFGTVLGRLDRSDARIANLERQLEKLQIAVGSLQARDLHHKRRNSGGPLTQHEFSVFSQWGEDGIIAWLVQSIDVRPKVFVEFGVEDYSEANTRFLVEYDNWTGLVMDASSQNIDRVRTSELCWRHNLRAAHSLVTRNNVNNLFAENDISGDIGLLSIDIDGNDYWVWKAINTINPTIVVIEYNHRFGSELAVTIPYVESFRRGERHPVYYFGASLKALCMLASRKGYAFIGCNSNGVNAFFVRRDKLNADIKELSVADGYVAGTFTESRDERGLYTPSFPDREMGELMKLPLVTVTETGETEIV